MVIHGHTQSHVGTGDNICTTKSYDMIPFVTEKHDRQCIINNLKIYDEPLSKIRKAKQTTIKYPNSCKTNNITWNLTELCS